MTDKTFVQTSSLRLYKCAFDRPNEQHEYIPTNFRAINCAKKGKGKAPLTPNRQPEKGQKYEWQALTSQSHRGMRRQDQHLENGFSIAAKINVLIAYLLVDIK